MSKKGSNTALWIVMGIVGSLVLCCTLGVVLAVAVPNYLKFAGRSKQAECKSNLKAAYTAERSYYGEYDVFLPQVEKIGFVPERGNRYAYFLDPSGPYQDPGSPPLPGATGYGVDVVRYSPSAQVLITDLPPLPWKPGVTGECPKCEFTVICAGNLDRDPQLDVWSISSRDRTAPDGTVIPQGTPWHDVDDL